MIVIDWEPDVDESQVVRMTSEIAYRLREQVAGIDRLETEIRRSPGLEPAWQSGLRRT